MVINSISLNSVTQGETKPLQQYMIHFAKVSSNIIDLQSAMSMHTILIKL